MLPTPAIRIWSSRNAFTGARRPRASACRCAPSNAGSNGSRPRRAAEKAARRAAPSWGSPGPNRPGATDGEEGVALRDAELELARPEPPRIDERQAVLAEIEDDARVRRARIRVEEQRPGHAQVQREEDVVGEREDEVLATPAEPLDTP